MRWILLLLFSLSAAPGARGAETAAPGVTGKPRFVRNRGGRTEIFFSNLKTPYVLPNDDTHNDLLHTVEAAMKSGGQVKFTTEPGSRRIQNVESVKPEPPKPTPTPDPATQGPMPEKDPFEQLLPMDGGPE